MPRLTVPDENRKSFVERLHQVIADESARSFALRAGLKPTTLQKTLRGETEPTRPNLVAIARAAGVSLHWLATGEGPMRPGSAEPAPAPEASIDLELVRLCVQTIKEFLDELNEDMEPEVWADTVVKVYQAEMEARAQGRSGASPAQLLRLVRRVA